MFFPLAVKQTLRIQTNGSISSEAYVFNHIIGYMEDEDMTLRERTEKQLFFSKINPIRTLRKSDTLRNVSFRIDFPGNEMKITLESETIVWFVMGILAGAGLFVLAPQMPIPMKLVLVIGIWSVGWMAKLTVLNMIKHELRPILEAI
jgi:hypothetical protein